VFVAVHAFNACIIAVKTHAVISILTRGCIGAKSVASLADFTGAVILVGSAPFD